MESGCPLRLREPAWEARTAGRPARATRPSSSLSKPKAFRILTPFLWALKTIETAGWLPLKGLGFYFTFIMQISLTTKQKEKGRERDKMKKTADMRKEQKFQPSESTRLTSCGHDLTVPAASLTRRQTAPRFSLPHPHVHPLPLLNSNKAFSEKPPISTRITPGN